MTAVSKSNYERRQQICPAEHYLRPARGEDFPPAKSFSERAHIKSLAHYRKLTTNRLRPESLEAGEERAGLVQALEKGSAMGNLPFAKWFLEGRLNVVTTASTATSKLPLPTSGTHLEVTRWPNREARYYHKQLHREVCLFANVLKRNGLKKGDRVIIYLPMVPEAAIAMLACARIGAVHSVVFGGFSAQSVADRIFDCQARLVITADGGFRRGTVVPLKKNVDDALTIKDANGTLLAKTIEKITYAERAGNDIHIEEAGMSGGIASSNMSTRSLAEKWTAKRPFFILYTSGSTGKPGILHDGRLLARSQSDTKYVFDLHETDLFWHRGRGWVTGHSYVVYGPLANGTTSLMYRARRIFPSRTASGASSKNAGVTILTPRPRRFVAFMKWGTECRETRSESLRLLAQWRTDQSGSLDLVSRGHRRKTLSDR
jgi:acetyl-CoA synthetase